jgi:protein required for attachment to host cells
MKFSVPKFAMIVIADGAHAMFYKNIATSGIKIEKIGELSPGKHDGRGSAPTPHETSPHEKGEANFAKDIANDLYERIHKGGIDAVVLIADPQTLGQIRPSLHKEVTQRITGEMHKTLTKSSIAEIENILTVGVA